MPLAGVGQDAVQTLPPTVDAGRQDDAFARQAGGGSDDLAGSAFGGAADRTAGIAVERFGIDGAAGTGRSLHAVLAVLARRRPRAGALRPRWARRAGDPGRASIALGTIKTSAQRNRGDAEHGDNRQMAAIGWDFVLSSIPSGRFPCDGQ